MIFLYIDTRKECPIVYQVIFLALSFIFLCVSKLGFPHDQSFIVLSENEKEGIDVVLFINAVGN